MAMTEITVDVGLEPTEKAKAFVRSVVVDVLKEMFADGAWMEERVNEAIGKAMVREARKIGFPVGVE